LSAPSHDDQYNQYDEYDRQHEHDDQQYYDDKRDQQYDYYYVTGPGVWRR